MYQVWFVVSGRSYVSGIVEIENESGRSPKTEMMTKRSIKIMFKLFQGLLFAIL